MSGWIKLYRSIMNHWVFQDADYFQAWCTILMRVNHEPKKVLIRGTLIHCERGQSLLSLQSWVYEFGASKWSIQRVRTFLKLLEEDGMITTEGMNKTTRLTVCNYEDYQGDQQTNNMQLANGQHAGNTHLTTTKEGKNDKNIPAKDAGGDFVEQAYSIFKQQYKKHRGSEYVVATRGKDRSAIGKIVNALKKRRANTDKNTEQMLLVMDNFFDHAVGYDDSFLQENMTPPIILAKINTLLSPKKSKDKYNPHKHVM